MTTTLATFISARRAEIKALLAELRTELKALDIAEAAIAGIPAAPEKRTRGPRQSGKPTIKDMIGGVLSEKFHGTDANNIKDLIGQSYGKDISRASLSPQLSRMKADGDLELDDKTQLWKLTDQGRSRYYEPDWDLMADDARMEASLARGPKE